MGYVPDKYPTHRYHPSLAEGEFVRVVDETEDLELMESDELWRDKPYGDAERAEWKAKNPKAAKATKPVAGGVKSEPKKPKGK